MTSLNVLHRLDTVEAQLMQLSPAPVATGSTVVNAGNLGSAYTPDGSVSKDILIRGTLNANLTLSTPTGAVAGTTITFELTQDATGGRAVTWFTSTKPGGNLPQSSSASALDVFTAYTPDGTNWRVFAAGIGMA